MAPRIRSLLIVAAASALAPKPASRAVDRRQLAKSIAGLAGAIAGASAAPANAVVYLDPARYGDQELKNAAIAKCRTRVRDVIAKDPSLACSFFLLAL